MLGLKVEIINTEIKNDSVIININTLLRQRYSCIVLLPRCELFMKPDWVVNSFSDIPALCNSGHFNLVSFVSWLSIWKFFHVLIHQKRSKKISLSSKKRCDFVDLFSHKQPCIRWVVHSLLIKQAKGSDETKFRLKWVLGMESKTRFRSSSAKHILAKYLCAQGFVFNLPAIDQT